MNCFVCFVCLFCHLSLFHCLQDMFTFLNSAVLRKEASDLPSLPSSGAKTSSSDLHRQVSLFDYPLCGGGGVNTLTVWRGRGQYPHCVEGRGQYPHCVEGEGSIPSLCGGEGSIPSLCGGGGVNTLTVWRGRGQCPVLCCAAPPMQLFQVQEDMKSAEQRVVKLRESLQRNKRSVMAEGRRGGRGGEGRGGRGGEGRSAHSVLTKYICPSPPLPSLPSSPPLPFPSLPSPPFHCKQEHGS